MDERTDPGGYDRTGLMVDTAEPDGEPEQPGDKPILSAGTKIDHFVVTRLLSRGGMGEVYLARDAKLGRRVAVKLIRASQLDSPSALSRFVLEARATAKFNHPHIVTIHGAGEYQGRPYVALEYLEGVNLRARMLERRFSHQEAARMMLAVAEALSEAHRVGVLHLDLKPENVVIPRDGRVRVVDFGLARTIGGGSRVVDETSDGGIEDEPTGDLVLSGDGARGFEGWGTAAYMAPEQWRQGPSSGATDVWALGVMLFELLAGRLPWDDRDPSALRESVASDELAPSAARWSDAPPRLADIIAGCLRKDPRARLSPAEVARELRAMLAGERVLLDDEQSPFRGLLPFTERHVELFFGRDVEVAALVERLRHEPVLPVVGPSGAGKSSLVRAGVIPRLREQQSWLVLSMRPGSRPFMALAGRLLRKDSALDRATLDQLRTHPRSDPPPSSLRGWESLEQLAAELRATPRRLALELRELAAAQSVNVLLFIDQLEELFTLVDDESERRSFMEAVCTAADDANDPVRVVFSVREDFMGRLATGPEVRQVLSSIAFVQPPGEDALKDVLVKPLEVAGYRYEEPQIVDEMIAAVRGEQSALPLLQFTAQRLWDERHPGRKLLLRSAYERIGGVEGALASHADGVLESLGPEERGLARKLVLRMVTPERTRRVLSRDAALVGLGESASGVLKRITDARLVAIRRASVAETGVGVTLELAHESLISSWRTLSRWLDESKEELLLASEVAQAANLWHGRGRRPEELWQGQALAEARRHLDRGVLELEGVAAEFMSASARREVWRSRRRRALFAAAIGTLATIALVMSLQKREADRARGAAESHRAEAMREGARAALGQGRLLEARAKLRAALESETTGSGRALWWQLSTSPLLWSHELGAFVYDAAFSPDGTRLAVASLDGSLYLFDAVTADQRVLRGHGDQVAAVTFTPDGRHLVTGGFDRSARIWDAASGREELALRGHQAEVVSVAVSADGSKIATASEDKTARLWAMDGHPLGVLEHATVLTTVVLDRDGTRLVTGAKNGVIFVWDTKTSKLAKQLTGHVSMIRALALSPDGTTLVSASDDRSARVWDLPTGEVRNVILAAGAMKDVSFSADGKWLMVASDDAVQIWDAQAWQMSRTFDPGHGTVTSATLDGAHGLLATTGADNRVRLWSTQAPTPERPLAGHTKGGLGIAFSPDGKLLASASYDTTVRLWEVESGEPIAVMRGHSGTSYGVAFSADGTVIASGSSDGTIRVWDPKTRTELRMLSGHQGGVFGVAFFPANHERGPHVLASGGSDGAVRLWNADTGEQIAAWKGHEGEVSQIAVSRDGQLVASAGADATARLWDASTGKTLKTFRGHDARVDGVALSPDRRLLATGSYDEGVRIFDTESGKPRLLAKHDGRVYWLSFDLSGERLVTASSDGSGRIWNVDSGEYAPLLGHRGEVNVATTSADGRLVATTSDDTTVRVWQIEGARPHWQAAALLDRPPRLFSHRGWRRLDTRQVEPPPASAWRTRVESAALAAGSSSQAHHCIVDPSGEVEIWDRAKDARIASWPPNRKGASVARVVATRWGCGALRNDGTAIFANANGEVGEIASDSGAVTAIGSGDDDLLLAAGDRIQLVSAQGRIERSLPASVGASALARIGELLVAGYRDGQLERIALDGRDLERVGFEGVPSSPPETILAGPDETVVVGYANGLVGMWSLTDGSILASARLHGRVVHVLLEARRLYAASDLGQSLVWDLEAFYLEDCALIRAVWARVPVVWEQGRAVVREPPTEHRCR